MKKSKPLKWFMLYLCIGVIFLSKPTYLSAANSLNIRATQSANCTFAKVKYIKPTCNNNDGEIEMELVGANTSNYTYYWMHGPSTLFINNLSSGIYYFVVINENGCKEICEVEVKLSVFISTPPDLTLECDQVVPIVTPPVVASGVVLTYLGETQTNIICPNSYTLVRSWVADGPCGNQKFNQNITIQDTKPPKFTFIPASVTVSAQSIPSVGVPVASDNCSIKTFIAYNGETSVPATCPQNFILTRTWTAYDDCKNSSTATQTIYVKNVPCSVFPLVVSESNRQENKIEKINTSSEKVENALNNESVTAMPNPFYDKVELRYFSLIAGIGSIKAYTTSGHEIQSFRFTCTEGANTVTINFDDYHSENMVILEFVFPSARRQYIRLVHLNKY